jgi:hypothetical protein
MSSSLEERTRSEIIMPPLGRSMRIDRIGRRTVIAKLRLTIRRQPHQGGDSAAKSIRSTARIAVARDG